MKSIDRGKSLLDECGTTTQMVEVYLAFQVFVPERPRPLSEGLTSSRLRCLRREKLDAGREYTVQLTPLVADAESAPV